MTEDPKVQTVRIAPSARNLAASLGVELGKVVGSGKNGAITNADVYRAAGVTPPEKSKKASPATVAAVKKAKPVFDASQFEFTPPAPEHFEKEPIPVTWLSSLRFVDAQGKLCRLEEVGLIGGVRANGCVRLQVYGQFGA